MKKIVFIYLIVITVAAGFLYSCSKDQAEEAAPENGSDPDDEITAGTVTYTNFVSGLIQTKCAGCHAAGGEGTVSWTFSGYSSVTASAGMINNAVLVTGAMPKSGSLTTREKALLKAWFDRDMPQ